MLAETGRMLRRRTLIAASHALSEQARLLSAVRGVGPTVPAALLGGSPELGALRRRRIASLVGPAPHARESGLGAQRDGSEAAKVREGLYIAALSASRRIPTLMATRARMGAAGEALKTKLIAIARQLRVILNAMVRTRAPIRLQR